jgi:hypothetical protein
MFKKTHELCVSAATHYFVLGIFGGRSLKKARKEGSKEGRGVVVGWGRKEGMKERVLFWGGGRKVSNPD